MAKNDNENRTTYGISALTSAQSVNIGRSDITTSIWTNGILNKFENLQELTNDDISYNIFEQTNINDISINSSIFKDVVDDRHVGEEQVLYVPIEMCTLYQVVDKVLPFAPYVYRNYCVEVEMIEW